MPLLFILFVSSLVALALIHIASLQFFLYWKYLWLDIPVHFLGGVTVAFGVALCMYNRTCPIPLLRGIMGYIITVLIIGITWEVFEILAKFSVVDEYFFTDTVVDLCMDVLGGIVGYGIVLTIKKLE